MTTTPQKRAIVTGASSGIGRATALELANVGWHVLAVARRSDALDKLASEHQNITPCVADITQADAPPNIMQTAQQRLGGVDLLVNNAGTSWVGTFDEMSDEKLDLLLNLNVRALMRMCSAAIEPLSESENGHIINVASIAAHVPMETLAVYCASKAAVVMFSRVLAKELAAKAIRVNVLSPSGTNTEIFERAGIELDSSNFITPEQQAKSVVALTQLPDGIEVVEMISEQRFNVM